MKSAIAPCLLLLVACNAPPAPAPVDPAPSASPPASAGAPVQQASLQTFRALGTEPFWHVDVDGERLLLTTPDDPSGQALTGTRMVAADGVHVRGSHAGQPFALRVRAGDCSDGMSDNRYPMVAEFEFGGQVLKGCADGEE